VNRINDLIAAMCPDGVELQALGDVGEFIRGRRITKSDFVESGVGCIHYGEIYTRYGTTAVETFTFVRPELAARLRLARSGDLIIAATGENAEEVCKAVAWLGAGEIAIHDDCYLYRHSFDPTYISYVFQSSLFHDQKIRFAAGAKMVRVSGEKLARIRVPVPPLEVQREIAAILGKMESMGAELEGELEAELEARRRQYADYRESLLAFDPSDGAGWATLGQAFEMRAGQHVNTSTISLAPSADRVYPCYGGNGLRGYVRRHSHQGPHLLVGRQGALCGNVRRVTGKFYATEHAVVLTARPGVDVNWAFHKLTAINLNQYASRSAQPGLAVGRLARVEISLPALEEQHRVAGVLDKFNLLVNDLSIGLPAELRARRQQYAHYRDRLLSFDQAAA
jgi:type I restriction enzyme S subunit